MEEGEGGGGIDDRMDGSTRFTMDIQGTESTSSCVYCSRHRAHIVTQERALNRHSNPHNKMSQAMI